IIFQQVMTMPGLTEFESRLLADVSRDVLWRHAETLAQWEKTSGMPGERTAVGYLGQQIESFGLKTSLYEFDSLLGWPEGASLEIRSPAQHSIEAITHAFTPSTSPDGLIGEVAYLGAGDEDDLAGQSVVGKIGLIEGMPAPETNRSGAAACRRSSWTCLQCQQSSRPIPEPRCSPLPPRRPSPRCASQSAIDRRSSSDHAQGSS